MSVWRTNPERYRREYFLGGHKLDTKYLRFGKGIAKLIEELERIQNLGKTKEEAIEELSSIFTLSEGTKEALLKLETEGQSEYEIDVTIRGVRVIMFLDKHIDDENIFREFKTGKIAWSQVKVQKHDQLLVYACGLRAKSGEMPEWCFLDWIETTEKSDESDDFFSEFDKKVNCTGKVQSFKRYFDERELDRMEEQLLKTAIEISNAYKAFMAEL